MSQKRKTIRPVRTPALKISFNSIPILTAQADDQCGEKHKAQ